MVFEKLIDTQTSPEHMYKLDWHKGKKTKITC